MGIPINEGYNEISMYFVSYLLKEGLIVSCVSVIIFIFVVIFENHIKKHGKNNRNYRD